MDTLGGLIDKLITVDMKMWYAQEDFYKIRNMTFPEFYEKYKSREGMRRLWAQFQKGIDLNLQRNVLIDEIDEMVLELTGVEDDGRVVQRKHKTY
jgi:hypothetical protein